MKLIDAHIHYGLPVKTKDLIDVLEKTNTDRCNLVALYDRKKASETIDCLKAKAELPGRIYVYGSLDLTNYYCNHDNIGQAMKNHVINLLACGCDGIKMLEGKPTARNRHPIPDFDLMSWDPYFAYLEESKTKVVWHVNDPEEFWDINKVPSWALSSGWYYGDNSINNIDQYHQIVNVLKRHPNLYITFAHFYFLSKNLELLGDLFDKFPNISVDLTPGIEMYTNFSNNKDKAKDFFIKYQDRIIYGTDISGSGAEGETSFNIKDALIRKNLVIDFLTLNNDIYVKGDKESLLGEDDFVLHPLGLTDDVVNKIIYENFYRLNKEPNKVNKDEVLKECQREKQRIEFLSEKFNKIPNFDYIDSLIEYFVNLK